VSSNTRLTSIWASLAWMATEHSVLGMAPSSLSLGANPEASLSVILRRGESSHHQQPNPQNGQQDPKLFAQPDMHAALDYLIKECAAIVSLEFTISLAAVAESGRPNKKPWP
jgi:hypothetical protein